MTNKEHIYFLVGIKLPQDQENLIQESIDELESLVKTAGGKVAGQVIQKRTQIDPVYYIGKGKLEEIDFLFDKTENQQAAVVFNASLSPSQVRNIEEVLECRVITRTELILDIFAIHAQSQIAKLQIETAQLSYLLPRLAGQGSTMSRTGGGIGTRGPGETKLETDRRKINRRIVLLKKELQQLDKSSQEKRKSRQQVFKVAVAGYTNAGKSSLARILSKESLYVENKLFSTIDTTTRKLKLDGYPAVITDTVGFIQDIPHELIESFKSTLSETVYADLVLHVVDSSSEFYENKLSTAEELFKEIKVESPKLLLFNKIDLIDHEKVQELKSKFPEALFISTQTNVGIEEIKKILKQRAIDYLETQGGIPTFLSYQ